MNSVADHTPSDEAVAAAVRELFQEILDGWNAGSGQRFAAPFTDPCDFIAVVPAMDPRPQRCLPRPVRSLPILRGGLDHVGRRDRLTSS